MCRSALYGLTGVVVSVVSVLLRIIKNFVTLILSLCRVDRSPVPAWFQRILDLDTVSRAYWGMVLEQHTHDNPVVSVFIDNMWQSIESKQQQQQDATDKDTDGVQLRIEQVSEEQTPRWLLRKRTINRLWLALLLHHNPSLRNHRKGFMAQLASRLETSRRNQQLRQQIDNVLALVKHQYAALETNGHGVTLRNPEAAAKLEPVVQGVLDTMTIDGEALTTDEKELGHTWYLSLLLPLLLPVTLCDRFEAKLEHDADDTLEYEEFCHWAHRTGKRVADKREEAAALQQSDNKGDKEGATEIVEIRFSPVSAAVLSNKSRKSKAKDDTNRKTPAELPPTMGNKGVLDM